MVWCLIKYLKIWNGVGVKHQHHQVKNTIHHTGWCWCKTPTPFRILNFDETPHHQFFSGGVAPHHQESFSWWCWCGVAPSSTLVVTGNVGGLLGVSRSKFRWLLRWRTFWDSEFAGTTTKLEPSSTWLLSSIAVVPPSSPMTYVIVDRVLSLHPHTTFVAGAFRSDIRHFLGENRKKCGIFGTWTKGPLFLVFRHFLGEIRNKMSDGNAPAPAHAPCKAPAFLIGTNVNLGFSPPILNFLRRQRI